MRPFREIDAAALNRSDLSAEMDAHGYVLIRNLLTADDLNPLLGEIITLLHQAGWLDAAADPLHRIANPAAACCEDDAGYMDTYEGVFSLVSFHAFPHQPALRRIMQALAGPKLLIHPKAAGRLIFPNFERGVIHAHQDHAAVAGDVETFTAWIPLHDCPPEQGALRILAGSHRFGLQLTEGCTGYIAPGTERGADWVGGQINAGDVLLFHSLTVHQAAPNRSNRLRISLDFRFQNCLRPVNPAALVFTGSGRRSWEKTYAAWPSDELKYYWTRLPLELKPSLADLAKLAQTAESPKLRQRYARILERIESQIPVAAFGD